MATDPRPGTNILLLLVLALLTGYLAWQVTPLRQRMDALERRQLETQDRLFGEMERLAHEIDALHQQPESAAPAAAASAKSGVAEKSSGDTASATIPANEPAAAPTPAAVDLVRFFSKRLLPEDATIASLMASGAPFPEIARTAHHSTPYLIGKGTQIEKTLAAAPDTPPEALRAIRRSLAQAKGER